MPLVLLLPLLGSLVRHGFQRSSPRLEFVAARDNKDLPVSVRERSKPAHVSEPLMLDPATC